MTKKQKNMTVAHPCLFGCLCLGFLVGGALVQDAYAGQEKVVVQLREPTISNEVLGTLRGGFVDSRGFMVSFGLDDVVKIDGIVTARTVLKLADLDVSNLRNFDSKSKSAAVLPPTFTFRQSTAGDHGNNAQTIVQNNMANGLASLVIQNRDDNKVIQHTRTLDLAISGYPTLKNIRLNSMVKARLIEALR